MSVVRVQLGQGVVRGCEEKLPDGRNFKRFSGIPFAVSPINELRFRSPQKLLKFEESEIDCSKERDACFHRHIFEQIEVGSEDCLYLNVYVPPNDGNSKLPVMVYIHGGDSEI
jgi:carboxylesterase type B